MINLETKTSYHYFDEYGMLVVKGDDRSWRDSLGRLILTGLAYGFTKEITTAIESCYRDGILYRHPAHDEVASRDHHSYFCIYRSYTYRAIPDFPRMRGMNQWMKDLKGGGDFWYYFWAIPGAYIGNWWLRKCRKWGRIWPEEDNRVWLGSHPTQPGVPGYLILSERTPRQKLWAWIIFQTMPAYALHNKAWQIYIMPKSPKRDTLRKILLKRVGQSNLMLRLLFQSGIAVTQEEIDNYPHMTGYRPGVYLDETCRRDIRELTDEEAEFNTYEVDLIKYLWNTKGYGGGSTR